MVTSEQAHELINNGFHVSILFTFLTIFFFMFISRKEKEAVTNELISSINNEIPVVLDHIDKGYQYMNKKPDWNAINQMAIKIKKKYNGKDPKIDHHNKDLIKMAIIICVVLFLILIGAIIYFSVYKKYDIHLKDILLENFFISVFVGVIELLFFLNIALTFTPVTQSDMINNIVNRTQYNINTELN